MPYARYTKIYARSEDIMPSVVVLHRDSTLLAWFYCIIEFISNFFKHIAELFVSFFTGEVCPDDGKVDHLLWYERFDKNGGVFSRFIRLFVPDKITVEKKRKYKEPKIELPEIREMKYFMGEKDVYHWQLS